MRRPCPAAPAPAPRSATRIGRSSSTSAASSIASMPERWPLPFGCTTWKAPRWNASTVSATWVIGRSARLGAQFAAEPRVGQDAARLRRRDPLRPEDGAAACRASLRDMLMPWSAIMQWMPASFMRLSAKESSTGSLVRINSCIRPVIPFQFCATRQFATCRASCPFLLSSAKMNRSPGHWAWSYRLKKAKTNWHPSSRLVDLTKADMERVNQLDPVEGRLRRRDDSGGGEPSDLLRRQAAAADADARRRRRCSATRATATSSSPPASSSCTRRRFCTTTSSTRATCAAARSTARMIWGNQASVLVGDFLLGQAFRMMVEVGSLEALDILSTAACDHRRGRGACSFPPPRTSKPPRTSISR